MLHTLLAAAEKTRDISIGEAAVYALLGFGVVFLGIAFLILVVWLVGKGMSKASGTSVEKKPLPKETIANIPAKSVKETEEISEETVAVITAALMAYYQQTGAKCEFTVKRIKRI